MTVGGKREGAGRPKGSRNVRTTIILEGVKAKGITPLEFLLSVMRDVGVDEGKRIDAAKAAAPYCHAKLQPIDKDGDTAQKVTVSGALLWQTPQ